MHGICFLVFSKISASMKTFVSDLTGKRYPNDQKISGDSVRTSLLQLIRQDYPEFDASKNLSLKELNIYRERYVADYLNQEVGKLSELERKVLDSMNEESLVSENPDDQTESQSSFGDRVADRVASFGGSWTFILIFIGFLLVWTAFNVFWLVNKGFDPYPFILLNLILSCLAALQAPVIMMSQNRQSDKDRQRAKEDYMVNLKSELEVRALHEKLDHLMIYQQQELIELQKIQIDMLTDLQKQLARERKPQIMKKEFHPGKEKADPVKKKP